jgi:hypothetical protein
MWEPGRIKSRLRNPIARISTGRANFVRFVRTLSNNRFKRRVFLCNKKDSPPNSELAHPAVHGSSQYQSELP